MCIDIKRVQKERKLMCREKKQRSLTTVRQGYETRWYPNSHLGEQISANTLERNLTT
jgi:hypothetical protein